MSRRAGQLLWNRKAFTIPGSGTDGGILDVDTKITQALRGEDVNSVNEPLFDTGPSPSVLVSRLEVVPLVPIDPWGRITHAEPYLHAGTDTLHVIFTNADANPAVVNCLFWDPHSLMGPGQADTYVNRGA